LDTFRILIKGEGEVEAVVEGGKGKEGMLEATSIRGSVGGNEGMF